MNLEFKDILVVHENSPELKRYSRTKMNDVEVELNKRVLEFYRKVFDKNAEEMNLFMFGFNFLGAGYEPGKGYYIIYDSAYGYHEVVLYGENQEAAFVAIISNIIEKKSQKNLFDNKESIIEEYSQRFAGVNNVCPMYHVEYVLDKFDKYYDGDIPQVIVDKYLRSVKYDGMVVAKYDEKNKKILLVEKEEEEDIKRRHR